MYGFRLWKCGMFFNYHSLCCLYFIFNTHVEPIEFTPVNAQRKTLKRLNSFLTGALPYVIVRDIEIVFS